MTHFAQICSATTVTVRQKKPDHSRSRASCLYVFINCVYLHLIGGYVYIKTYTRAHQSTLCRFHHVHRFYGFDDDGGYFIWVGG